MLAASRFLEEGVPSLLLTEERPHVARVDGPLHFGLNGRIAQVTFFLSALFSQSLLGDRVPGVPTRVRIGTPACLVSVTCVLRYLVLVALDLAFS